MLMSQLKSYRHGLHLYEPKIIVINTFTTKCGTFDILSKPPTTET
jgi:hypothetical protein